MKRHLRMKHRIHISDMRGSSGHDVMTQIVPMENPDGITSDVQVTEYWIFSNFCKFAVNLCLERLKS